MEKSTTRQDQFSVLTTVPGFKPEGVSLSMSVLPNPAVVISLTKFSNHGCVNAVDQHRCTHAGIYTTVAHNVRAPAGLHRGAHPPAVTLHCLYRLF